MTFESSKDLKSVSSKGKSHAKEPNSSKPLIGSWGTFTKNKSSQGSFTSTSKYYNELCAKCILKSDLWNKQENGQELSEKEKKDLSSTKLELMIFDVRLKKY